ncbi:YtxH domain-containing protein [Spirosoma soli]|uniref:YtxH domain-containing protein n=1 Tax=Spirosoma soli TaxID=1770529 RepID=A0ABW5M4S4_9BACT
MRSTRDFFVGIATGVTIGLLTAPRTGRESRQWLKSEYDKRTQSGDSSSGPGLKEKLMTAYEQVKEQVNNYIQQQKNHKERMTDTGKFDYQLNRAPKPLAPSDDQSLPSSTHQTRREHKAQIIPE